MSLLALSRAPLRGGWPGQAAPHDEAAMEGGHGVGADDSTCVCSGTTVSVAKANAPVLDHARARPSVGGGRDLVQAVRVSRAVRRLR